MCDCQFCRYVKDPSGLDIIMETDNLLIFDDDRPHDKNQPMHRIAMTKKHLSTAERFSDEDAGIMGELFQAAYDICRRFGMEADGVWIRSLMAKERPFEMNHFHCHIEGSRPLPKLF